MVEEPDSTPEDAFLRLVMVLSRLRWAKRRARGRE